MRSARSAIEPLGHGGFPPTPRTITKKRIYASIHFWHPEYWKSPGLAQLARVSRHGRGKRMKGAYLGHDETTNSPANYHSHGWHADGYPCRQC